MPGAESKDLTMSVFPSRVARKRAATCALFDALCRLQPASNRQNVRNVPKTTRFFISLPPDSRSVHAKSYRVVLDLRYFLGVRQNRPLAISVCTESRPHVVGSAARCEARLCLADPPDFLKRAMPAVRAWPPNLWLRRQGRALPHIGRRSRCQQC